MALAVALAASETDAVERGAWSVERASEALYAPRSTLHALTRSGPVTIIHSHPGPRSGERVPTEKNGKRVALVGAGPASLTVANDLMPLGYDVVIYEAHKAAGGLMRVNIPSFRLPAEVLDEETQIILDMGVDIRY